MEAKRNQWIKVIALTPVLVLAGIIGAWAVSGFGESQVGTASKHLKQRLVPAKPAFTMLDDEAEISHVVVKLHDKTEARLRGGKLTSPSASLGSVREVLKPYQDGRMSRLFRGWSETQLDGDRGMLQARSGQELADLNTYYEIEVNDLGEAQTLVNHLNDLDEVEIAYAQPAPEEAGDISPPTPDYQEYQDYREPAPEGVDADYANTLAGGDGTGVKIIDIEINWQTTHEDLDRAVGNVIGAYPGGGSSSDHGTAVIGEMIAGDNGYGVTGICPGAEIGMVSVAYQSTAQALYTAIDNLESGDIILIELHAPGPRYNFQSRPDQLGYVCMEYWQANYDAILYAWAKGIVVIEAAGNGAEDFDDPIYGSLYDTAYRNSHAIIAGAGYPPASGQDRQRQGFSNYGERVNLQGYGSGVYTCGYGNVFDGDGDRNQFYTAYFSGTSSASPIVTGAAACLQGYYEESYGVSMTSDMIRDVLTSTGSPQQGLSTEHIGPRPDLQAAIAQLASPPSLHLTPILIDTMIDQSTILDIDIWLKNRSGSQALDFTAVDSDSLGKEIDWLSALPISGMVGPADSTLLTVTIDATVLAEQVERYRGVVEVNWGPLGGSLDSTLWLPVYVTVPCNDTTYRATKTGDPEGPEYRWIDARTLGTKLDFDDFYHGGATNKLDDGSAGPFNIGFKFPFYDTTFNRLYVGVNGGISFTDTSLNVNGYYSGIEIPGAPFSTIIAPFWVDLIFDTTVVPDGGIYKWNDPQYDTLVLQWYHPGSFNDPNDTSMSFEVILTVDGSIVFQYADLGVSGLEENCLIGVAGAGCEGLSYVNTGDIPEHIVGPGEAVRFYFTDREWVMAGDVDGSGGGVDIADLIYLVTYMFQGGPPPVPYESGNVDCIGDIDIADLVYLVNYMFQGGPGPCHYFSPL